MRAGLSGCRDFFLFALCAAVIATCFGLPAAASDITAPIEQFDAGLMQIMKAGKATPFQQRYDTLAPLVLGAFNLDLILQGGIGASWASLPPDQQAALTRAFQRYSIAICVANFNDFSGQRFELTAPVTDADPVVRVRIVPGTPDDPPHVLGYVMRPTSAGWKAADVTADGYISLVTVQQAEIRALMGLGGAARVLARLQQKTAELSEGVLQ
jgi:phospholipid transport system substrate-binding protein